MARNAHQQQHRHKVCHHLFADDMQGRGSGPFDDFPVIVSRLEGCIADIYAWCGAKRLQLNADKTELLWFCSALQLHQLSSQTITIHVDWCVIDRRPRSGHVVRRQAVDALTHHTCDADVLLSTAPNTCCP